MIKVHILDKDLIYENDRNIIGKMFNDINNIISSSGYILSHLLIDRIEIYEKHHKVIEENIDKISTIEVVLITMSDLLSDNLEEMKKHLKTMKDSTSVIAKNYYINSRDNNKFVIDFMEGIIYIKKVVDLIHGEKEINNKLEIDSTLKSFDKIFIKIEECIDKKDYITIGDMFIKEIKGKIERLNVEIRKIEISI